MEPKWQIGDHVLTEAQAFAVRVAITLFSMSSVEGREPIDKLYAARLGEVIKIIFEQSSATMKPGLTR